MKKEVKNKGNNGNENNNVQYKKLKYNSIKKSANFPSLEIVMKKEIKDYENKRHNQIYTRNKFTQNLNNYRSYTNTPIVNNTISHAKSKNFQIIKFDKISSPSKKLKNNKKYIKINNFRNYTENRNNSKPKIMKKNISQSPNSVNLLDFKISNTFLSQNFDKNINNKTHLTNKSLNLNIDKNKKDNHITNFKRSIKCSKAEKEKFIENYINKKLFVDKNNNSNVDNYSYNKTINTDRNTKINFKSYNPHLFSISQNSKDDLPMSGIKHNNYEVLLLSKTGNININNNKISTNIEKNRIKSTKKYFLRNKTFLEVKMKKIN